MSNTKRATNGSYSLKKYRAEAKGEPFVLDVDENSSITIPWPTVETTLAVQDAESEREGLEALCGEQAKKILDLVGDDNYLVLQGLVNDMLKHFGLGEHTASRR